MQNIKNQGTPMESDIELKYEQLDMLQQRLRHEGWLLSQKRQEHSERLARLNSRNFQELGLPKLQDELRRLCETVRKTTAEVQSLLQEIKEIEQAPDTTNVHTPRQQQWIVLETLAKEKGLCTIFELVHVKEAESGAEGYMILREDEPIMLCGDIRLAVKRLFDEIQTDFAVYGCPSD